MFDGMYELYTRIAVRRFSPVLRSIHQIKGRNHGRQQTCPRSKSLMEGCMDMFHACSKDTNAINRRNSRNIAI